MSNETLFSIKDLRVRFGRHESAVEVVRGVSLDVDHGELLGLVGESGSGKSVTMLAALGLLPDKAQITGSVRYKGRELIGLPRRELRKLRGSRISMIFQDPLSSFNPVVKIGAQIAEVIQLHNPSVTKSQAYERAVSLLDMVSIPQPDRRVHQYPHEFSGGMRQRVMIAMAVANEPDVLIADEPTTALDVTVQAQIMEVLAELQDRLRLGMVLITHDLGVLAGYADRVAVAYSGRLVEQAPVDALFRQPLHPYTRGLIASIPDLQQRTSRLFSIDGAPPSLLNLPSGCAFNPRCPEAQPVCIETRPELTSFGDRCAACHFAAQHLEVVA